MPDFDSTSPLEEIHWPFARALAHVIHRDVAQARQAPPFFSGRKWPPETFEGFRSLTRACEGGAVGSIDNCGPVQPIQWINLQQILKEFEENLDGWRSFERFVAKVGRLTHNMHIRVADLLAAFPASGEMEGDPTPDRTKKPLAFSDMKACCSNHAGACRTAPEMDAALTARFGVRDRETLCAVRKAASFKGAPKGRRPGSKNKPVKSPRRSK